MHKRSNWTLIDFLRHQRHPPTKLTVTESSEGIDVRSGVGVFDQKSQRVLVVVCTYNEIANLPELVSRIFSAIPTVDVLIVDDQSPDGTGQWAERASEVDERVRAIIRVGQRGLGGATRLALQYAVDHGYDFVLNLDGDLSHDPAVLPTLLGRAVSDPTIDVVVGSRYLPGGSISGWPRHRRWMSRAVNGFATQVLGLPVSDCSGSFRCYRVAALAKLPPSSLKSNSYAILEEVLVRLGSNGAKMVEVPIRFVERERGRSKLTLFQSIKSAWHLVRVAASMRRHRQ